jgi:hypothetical protein
MPLNIEKVDFTVDENIWGHRLYDEQLPHLTVLEFLGALGSNLDKPLRPQEGLYGTFKFQPQRQIRLRALLFNNPYVESISESAQPDEEKWRQWFERFARGRRATAMVSTTCPICVIPSRASTILPRPVELLRSSSFESRSNKRWSSKFVFPFGPDALYEDLRDRLQARCLNDRRFLRAHRRTALHDAHPCQAW